MRLLEFFQKATSIDLDQNILSMSKRFYSLNSKQTTALNGVKSKTKRKDDRRKERKAM